MCWNGGDDGQAEGILAEVPCTQKKPTGNNNEGPVRRRDLAEGTNDGDSEMMRETLREMVSSLDGTSKSLLHCKSGSNILYKTCQRAFEPITGIEE